VARALGVLAAASGDVDAAVRYLLRVLEKDPWDEEAHLTVVRTFDRARRHGEATRCYRAYVSRMEEIRVAAAPFPS